MKIFVEAEEKEIEDFLPFLLSSGESYDEVIANSTIGIEKQMDAGDNVHGSPLPRAFKLSNIP